MWETFRQSKEFFSRLRTDDKTDEADDKTDEQRRKEKGQGL